MRGDVQVCKAISEGGQRCAAHTRARFESLSPSDGDVFDEAAAEYASTGEGRQVLAARARAAAGLRDYELEARLVNAVVVGRARQAANSETADVIRSLATVGRYGPQDEQINDYVFRVANLTSGEAEQIRQDILMTHERVWNNAWFAAEVALDGEREHLVVAEAAVWGATGRDIRDAFGGSEPSLARVAACAGVRGLAARHLIGRGVFTQAHYDILTTPWRKTVGQVHFDDEPL